MVMEPSCKISLCVFPSILFWIYCFDFYHVYVHIKAQLFIVKVNLQSMSFSVFCLPRLEVWSCSLTSISAWLTLSPLSLGSPFCRGVCPWPWLGAQCKGPLLQTLCALGERCWCLPGLGRAQGHPAKSPWLPPEDKRRAGAGRDWKEKYREEEDGRK